MCAYSRESRDVLQRTSPDILVNRKMVRACIYNEDRVAEHITVPVETTIS